MKKSFFKLNLVSIFTILFFTLFPLITNNYYFDIAKFRYRVFTVLALGIFFAALYYTLCIHIDKKEKMNVSNIKQSFSSLSTIDKWVLGFLLTAVISTLLSDWKLPALTGSCGRYNGLLFLLMAGGLYYGITRYLEPNCYLKLSFPIILIATCLMAVIQFCGYDPFGFIKNISEDINQSYISTLGNLNVFAAFLSVYLPVCMYLFCSLTEKYRLLYGFACLMGFLGILASNSDSCYLGTIIPLAILLIAVSKDAQRLCYYSLLLGILASALIIWTFLEYLFSSTMWVQSFLTKSFHSPLLILLIIAGMIILFLVSSSFLQKEKELPNYLHHALIGIYAVFVCLVVGAFLWFSIVDTKTDLGALTTYLRFNKSWGSDRGTAWIWIFESFFFAPFLTKCFGTGPDTTSLSLYSNYKYEIDHELGFYFENAHNEYINYLGTMGIFGLICYVAMLISALKTCFQKQKKDSFFGAVGFAIIGYACMSTVNISQPITVPFIFLLIAIAHSKTGG